MPVATVGDLDIVWEEQGAGEPVILISGLGSPRAAWREQTAALAGQFRVIAFDNRDVGETGTGRDQRFYVMRVFGDDVAGLMDEIGIERAHIVGASLGGAVAQELAINHPDRIQTLTLACTYPKADGWLVELLNEWEQTFEERGAVTWQRSTFPWGYTHRWFADPENLRNALAEAVATPPHQTAEMFFKQSNAAKKHDALTRLGRIKAPTHIICGAEDILTPLRHSQQLAEHIAGSRLTVLPNTGHALTRETPAAFNQALIEFLRFQGRDLPAM